VLDDGVTQLAKHASLLTETLHSNAVGRVDVEPRQHGVSDAGTKHDVMTKVLGALLAIRRVVHVKPVDHASISAVLCKQTTLRNHSFLRE